MMCLPKLAGWLPMTSMCPVADCLGHTAVCARVGDAVNAARRKTTTAEPALALLMATPVCASLRHRIKKIKDERTDARGAWPRRWLRLSWRFEPRAAVGTQMQCAWSAHR